jgi:peptide/nickel transport system permease protein
MKVTTSSTLTRVAKYAIVRAILLSMTVVVGVFLAILATNYGGYIDDIFREGVDYGIINLSQSMRDVPAEQRFEFLEQARWEMEETAGLHQPFLARCFRWLGYGLTLNWGAAGQTRAGVWVLGTREAVLPIILERLGYTLLLAGSANLLLFFATVGLALALSRKHGSWLDKLLITLSPISSIPNWIHGILLIVIFAAGLRILPFGGMFGDQPPGTRVGYIPVVLQHMILPVAAIFLGSFFQSVYAWRSYFLLHAEEDYVELARARGLPPRMLERQHILRPSLPTLLTSLALMLISFWQGAIILEVFFSWPGIGKLFIESIQGLNRPLVVGLVVTFAYLLAITVFILDIVYAVVDPRVRVGSAGQAVRAAAWRKRRRLAFRLPRRPVWRRPSAGWHMSRAPEPLPGEGEKDSDRKVRWKRTSGLKPVMREMARYPSVFVGLATLVLLIGVSVYALIAMPYEETVGLWRGEGDVWYQNPKKALPQWINLFRKNKLPPTIILDSRDSASAASKSSGLASEGMAEVTLSFPFDFSYGEFPQDLVIYFEAQYEKKKPHLSLAWLTPDGREIDMGRLSIAPSQTYYLSQDRTLQRRLGGGSAVQALFADPAEETPVPLRGAYELRVSGLLFEEEADLDAEFLLQGQVYGLAGTDHQRRDLLVGLLWGMPVALAFGLLGAAVTATSAMVIAAVGTWFGGWVDNAIQRLTEVNMILPVIPICITLYLASSKSIWVILGVMVVLNIFGSAIKNYRAIFLQVKEEPHIEAARAYGASDRRIILRYLVPRIIPVLIPQLVILVPSYVFLEAMLAYLGVSDPTLPTWGKLIEAGISHGLYTGAYHMLLEPLSLLLLVGLAFVMLSLALERIFQSRLRKM